MTPQAEALRLLDEALKESESPKGSVYAAVQKLSRASILIENTDVQRWCLIQFGERKYVRALRELLDVLTVKSDPDSPETEQATSKALKKLDELGLKHNIHFTNEELNIKAQDSGGGYLSIAFIEERYADLIRIKRGNDGTYFKNHLSNHLSYVRRKAHDFASALYNQLKFSGTVSNCFDVLKSSVDDRLLDLDPTLGEQLMLAFKSVSSTKSEEWSQSLTTCRRLLEGLADQLYPASTQPTSGRALGQTQYVNRLWAFMDKAIESDSNKSLAKSHVDYLGSWLEKVNKLTNKGVHADVTQLEAIKTLFHTYLAIADLLEYLTAAPQGKSRADINTASLDEIEALLDVKRATAKEIIKARVQHGKLDKSVLSKVPGVGAKTLEKAISVFNL